MNRLEEKQGKATQRVTDGVKGVALGELQRAAKNVSRPALRLK